MPGSEPPVAVSAEPADTEQGGVGAILFRGARGLVSGGTFACLLLLAVLLFALERWGEKQWLLSLLLFVPPQIFLAPLALLFVVALIFRPRLCLWIGGAAAAVIFGYMGLRLHSAGSPGPQTLTVITHNMGQGSRAQFAKFVAAENPDLLVLQDAAHRGPALESVYPGASVETRGEFTLVSHHLIEQAKLLTQPHWRHRPVAARFVVNFQGKSLAVYSVHMPTPRHQFSRFLSPRIAKDLLEDGDPSSQLVNYREWIGDRDALARSLAERLREEKLPFIVGGDFNMPDHGGEYHLFANNLSDAFATSGRGCGFTFPGGMHFPVSLLGPWLRIDYLFAGRGWTPISCAAETGTQSQHRAVVARFNPTKAPRP